MIRTQAREGVRSAIALAGSAAQSRFQLFPGDCDFFERVHITAPTREDAVEVLAATMIEAVARTFTNPHLQFVEMKLGLYPAAYSRDEEPVSQGSPISWGLTDMDVRVVRVVDATGETHRLRMHEVAMDPGFVKLDWVYADREQGPRRPGVEGDRRDLGGAGRLDRRPGRRARQLLPGGLPRPREPGRRRAAGAARLARRPGELPRPDHGRDRQVLRRGPRELRQGRQAALQHHPDPAARRRRVVPAAALRRPARAALPGRRHHARAQRRRSARTGSTGRRSSPSWWPSRAPSPTATPARTATRSSRWCAGCRRWTRTSCSPPPTGSRRRPTPRSATTSSRRSTSRPA